MAREFFIDRLLEIQQTNFEVIEMRHATESIEFEIWHKSHAVYECSGCGKKHTSAYDFRWIVLNDVPIGRKSVRWKIWRARVDCACSRSPRVEKLEFRSHQHQLTKRFVSYIEQVLCSKMFTVMDTSRLFGLDYGTVYKIDHTVLLRLAQHLKIPDPINISVDEKSFKKGHQYVTIVSDLDRGKAIWVSTGNSQESLDEFFKILGPERCAKIKVVAKDNHKPYTASCNLYVPQATQVTDKFHLVQRLGKMLDDCRREIVGDPNNPNIKLPKGLHWVLRHKEENLNPKDIPSLGKLKKLNEKLYEVYLLKEKFFIFFNYGANQIDLAVRFINNWIQEAYELNLKSLNDFIHHLRYHAHTILNILRTKMTSALSEGINRKITVIKQMAYGYRNINYFKLKIMQRCGLLGALYQNLTTHSMS